MQISNEEWEAFKGSRIYRAIEIDARNKMVESAVSVVGALNRHMDQSEIAFHTIHSNGFIEGLEAVLNMDLGEDIKE